MLLRCLLAHSAVCQGPVWMTSNLKVTLCPLPLTWFCLALGGSGCRHSGSCRRTATGWWSPGPSAEPWPRGWVQRRLWQCACRIRERTMWDKDTGTFSKVFYDTAEVQGDTGERERETVWVEDSFHCLNKCIPSENENSTRLKLNSTELMGEITPPYLKAGLGIILKNTHLGSLNYVWL